MVKIIKYDVIINVTKCNLNAYDKYNKKNT